MSQTLVLPLNDLRVTAAYKSQEYKTYWGFNHFGMDCTSPVTTVYACGDGEVVACGQDGATLTGSTARLGNVIVIIYKDVLRNDGVTCDLVSRMYHFAQVNVKVGDKVTKDTIIGLYGNTGAKTSGPHLHIEFDTDIKYPLHAYGVAGGKIIKSGTIDSSVNPAKVWFVDSNQQIKGAAGGWYAVADVIAPALPKDEPKPDYYTMMCAELQAVMDKYKDLMGV